MLEEINAIFSQSLSALSEAKSKEALETWYRETLSRKGRVTLMTRQVGKLGPEERPVFGKRVNQVKKELETAYQDRQNSVRASELQSQLAADSFDVTLPGRREWRGRRLASKISFSEAIAWSASDSSTRRILLSSQRASSRDASRAAIKPCSRYCCSSLMFFPIPSFRILP